MALLVMAAPAVAGQAPGAARLLGDPGPFFGPDAYPPEAIRNSEQGRTVVDLTIGPDGRVTDCALTTSSGSDVLDTATCRIAYRKLRFAPATDAAGRAIAAHYPLPVRWVLPMPSFAPRRSSDERLTLTLGPDDRVEACGHSKDGVVQGGEHPFCAGWRSGGAAMIARLRARTGAGRVTLILQRAISFLDAPVAEAQAAPGRTVLGLRRAVADVLPDGTTANGQIVEQAGTMESAPDPIATLDPFETGPATQRVQVLIALSYAVTPAAPAGVPRP